MPNVQHSTLTAASGIHVLQAWEAANAAARTAIVGVAADVGKVCRQADDGSFWVLTAAPSTWVQLGTSGGGSAASVIAVSASRSIAPSDAGNILRCTAAGVSLTVPTNATAAVATGATILVTAAASSYVLAASGVTVTTALNPTGSASWKYKLVEGGSVLLAKLATNAWHLTGSYDLEGA